MLNTEDVRQVCQTFRPRAKYSLWRKSFLITQHLCYNMLKLFIYYVSVIFNLCAMHKETLVSDVTLFILL